MDDQIPWMEINSYNYGFRLHVPIIKTRYWIISCLCVGCFFFGPNPWFLRQTLVIICQSLRAPLRMECFLCQTCCLGTYPLTPSYPSTVGFGGCYVREYRCSKQGGMGVDLNGWVCIGVHKTILAQNFYCAKPNPKPNSQYESHFFKRLGTQSPRIIWGYDLANTIVICPLTQPLTWKFCSYIFTAMIQLKVVSITWASLLIIPSTERMNGEKSIPWSCQCHPWLSFFIFSHLGKNHIHYLFHIGIRISISKSDVNDVIHLDLPYSPDWHVTPCLWNSPPVMHLPI